MKWRLATNEDLQDMGRKHWRDSKSKQPISAGSAFAWARDGGTAVEVLDESPSTPILGAEEADLDLIREFVDFVSDSNAAFIKSTIAEFWYINGRKDTPKKDEFILEFLKSDRYTAMQTHSAQYRELLHEMVIAWYGHTHLMYPDQRTAFERAKKLLNL